MQSKNKPSKSKFIILMFNFCKPNKVYQNLHYLCTNETMHSLPKEASTHTHV